MKDMDDLLTPPPGWRFAAYPWFAKDQIPELPKLIRVEPVLLPEFFHLVIGTEDAWHENRHGDSWVDPGPTVLFLDFQVYEGVVEQAHATSVFYDLPEVFERVRKVVPPSKWKRLGMACMAQYLFQFMEDGRRPDSDPAAKGWSYPSPKTRTPYDYQPKAAMEWLDKLETHASEAYAEAREYPATYPAPRKKRHRITDEFLQEVANTYRMAENEGVPPTREVANHFRVPHSTAARWVGSARKKKKLPPANLHEVPEEPHAARRLELEWWLHDSYLQHSIEIETDPLEKKRMQAQLDEYRAELESLGGQLPGRNDHPEK